MEKQKYIHFFFVNETKFLLKIINFINDNFSTDEHLFVTVHAKAYDAVKCIPNAEYYEANGNFADAVNYYSNRGEWLILHSLPKPMQVLKIKKDAIKKIIWRTWGHDTEFNKVEGEHLKNTLKRIGDCFFRHKVRQIKCVGVNNIVDGIAIKRKIGNIKMFTLNYIDRDLDSIFEKGLKQPPQKRETVNVLLGHSGHIIDNHINMLNSLKNYINENIRIYIPLSYGDKENIMAVKEYVKQLNCKKIIIIDEFMNYDEYVEFLNSMDIVILDGKRSYALGCVYIANRLKKKLYINDKGIIREAFDIEKTPYEVTSKIGKQSFSEFATPLDYSDKKEIIDSYSIAVSNWKKLFSFLDSSEGLEENG